MPQPHLRTRSKKQIQITAPGGKTKIHYRKAKTSKKLCSLCGKPLSGMPRVNGVKMHKLNYTKRKIWRLYGTKVCPKCLKNAIKQAARKLI